MTGNRKFVNIIKISTSIVLVILIALIINIAKNHNDKNLATELSLSGKRVMVLGGPNEKYEDKLYNEDTSPVFKYSNISDEIKEKMIRVSWKEDSPVKLEDLAYINVTYWGFDNAEHVGEMIVHEKLALEVLEIFKELYEARFSIEKIVLIDEYDANDDLSMADNNTSAFCSREVTGKKGVFSEHSYGVAIDINPIQNPYIKGDIVLPEEGSFYLDRNNVRKGMITKGDVCYNAFKNRGWVWGGEWNTLKDYQHFQKKIEDN
ncbi:M15 family metallopeptidase [Proteiniborus sp.]|uniref:M15 family metallopeptidase n=1 Tax=Proteiniborus sp. TaxID=2079015 RepID=UPI00331C4A37